MKNSLVKILGLTAISLSLGFNSIDFSSRETQKSQEQYNSQGAALYRALFPDNIKPYQMSDKELKDLERRLKESPKQNQEYLIASR